MNHGNNGYDIGCSSRNSEIRGIKEVSKRMNALEDKTLSREAMLGFLTFLISEAERHRRDIEMINNQIQQVIEERNITREEFTKCEMEAQKYVDF